SGRVVGGAVSGGDRKTKVASSGFQAVAGQSEVTSQQTESVEDDRFPASANLGQLYPQEGTVERGIMHDHYRPFDKGQEIVGDLLKTGGRAEIVDADSVNSL